MVVVAVVVVEVVVANRGDRFGIGWRNELAANILTHLDQIDIVEVIADDYFDISTKELRALRTLAQQVPVTLHGITLGLASVNPAIPKLLSVMARVVNTIEPIFWSEHLAFVRGSGIEIGHLAAPPRDVATIDGTAHNVALAERIVGIAPLLENVATLINPPGSTLSEGAWLVNTLQATNGKLLLDLHNLYTNARNFHFDAEAVIYTLPADRIGAVHLAGGCALPGGRWLDDHLHAIPDPVYQLLEAVGTHATQHLDIILERDGNYPPFSELLGEINQARVALARGRSAQVACVV